MKSFLSLFISFIISVNAVAAPATPKLPVDPLEPMPVVFHSGPDGPFTFFIPEGRVLETGETYFFVTKEGKSYQGTYREKNHAGQDVMDNFEPVLSADSATSERAAARSTPSNQPAARGSAPSSFGSGVSDVHNKAAGVAVRTGLSRAISRGLLDTDKQRAEVDAINADMEIDIQAIEQNYQKMISDLGTAQGNLKQALAGFKTMLESNPFKNMGTGFTYQSKDTVLVADLKEIEALLRATRATSPKRREARDFGLQMVQSSDQASAAGDDDVARGLRRYADAFLDIAVGLDPITGPIRDTYEAFTGKNLITGEELGTFERTFAVVGAVTFGFGSKLGKGLKIFERIGSSSVGKKALRAVENIFAKLRREVPVVENAAHNAANHQKYLQELRERMERPKVLDPDLEEFLQEYWRPESTVGNGSTAAAIRSERATGLPTGGAWHSQKGSDSITYFKRWQNSHPNAVASDKHTVENLLKDLTDTFGGQW